MRPPTTAEKGPLDERDRATCLARIRWLAFAPIFRVRSRSPSERVAGGWAPMTDEIPRSPPRGGEDGADPWTNCRRKDFSVSYGLS